MADEKKNLLGPYIPQGNFLRDFVQQVKLAYQLILDPRVHPLTKLIPVAALAYVVLPIDLIPDVIPVLGQMDDAAVLALGMRVFLEFAPPDVVHEHLTRLAQAQAIRENWKVTDNPPPPPPPHPPHEGEVVDGTYHVEE